MLLENLLKLKRTPGVGSAGSREVYLVLENTLEERVRELKRMQEKVAYYSHITSVQDRSPTNQSD